MSKQPELHFSCENSKLIDRDALCHFEKVFFRRTETKSVFEMRWHEMHTED